MPIVANPRREKREVPSEVLREEEPITTSHFEQMKREGLLRKLTYKDLLRLGYKLRSHGLGAVYRPVPIEKELDSQEERSGVAELESDPSDRVRMYARYLGVTQFDLYLCKLRFGKEIPQPPFRLQIARR